MNDLSNMFVKAIMTSMERQRLSHRISIIVDAHSKLKPIIPSVDVIFSLTYSVDNYLSDEELDLYNILKKNITDMDTFKCIVQSDMFLSNQMDFYLIDYIEEAWRKLPSNKLRTLLFHTIILIFLLMASSPRKRKRLFLKCLIYILVKGTKLIQVF